MIEVGERESAFILAVGIAERFGIVRVRAEAEMPGVPALTGEGRADVELTDRGEQVARDAGIPEHEIHTGGTLALIIRLTAEALQNNFPNQPVEEIAFFMIRSPQLPEGEGTEITLEVPASDSKVLARSKRDLE